MTYSIGSHVFKTIDGLDIEADIFAAEADRPLPAVVFIHGGGLIMGSRKAILPNQIRAFNEGGFHFVSINYRLAPEAKLPEIVGDLEDAWAWIRANADSLGIDRDRIAVLGHSAGGYLAQVGGFRLAPRPAAVVSLAGYGRLTTNDLGAPSPHYVAAHKRVDERDARRAVGGPTISESGPSDSMQRFSGRGLFYLFCRQQGTWLREVSGHSRDEHDWFKEYEPHRNVSAEYPPTMLLHGEPDTDVLIVQSEMMQRELSLHGVAHEFLRSPNWGHAFLYMPSDASVDEAFGQIVTFLQKHV